MRTGLVFIIISLLFLLACEQREDKKALLEAISVNPDYSSWSHYLGDPKRTHYSVLQEIDTTNASELKIAWQYQSGELEEGRNTQIQTNPLILGDQLYGISPTNSLFAIKADTGQFLWEFKPEAADQTGLGLSRGMLYWPGEMPEDERLFYASGPRLYALSPQTGSIVETFGDGGSIDLREGLGRPADKLPLVMTTPGVVFQDYIILGHRTSESPGAAPGHIRAFNAKTGKQEWIFHTIPQPGEFGYETWPEEAYKTTGGANNWAGMALDEANGLVFIPTGSAAFDWYGGDRLGDNLFANTLLALKADSGERVWHYQFVKHDVWDRDLPAPPNLLTVEMDGKLIPAVAQVTKSGHIFVFDRLTGTPLFPIEEKTYPATKLEGDQTAPSQSLPVKPLPFARQMLTEADLYAPERPAFVDDFIDKDQNISPPTVSEKLASVTSEGQFIPIDTRGVILYPGADGGAEWGGAAVDPRNGVMYVNANEMAWIVRMAKVGEKDGKRLSKGATLTQIHCARCHGGDLQGLGAIPELQNVKDRLSREAISEIIHNGKGAMPAMPNLNEDELASISAFIKGIEEPEISDHRAEDTPELPYAMVGFGRFKDDRGYPVVKPPWGTLNAIDLNTGEYLWKVPLGNEEKLNDPEYPESGTENYGGPVITAGGVLFIGATKDEKFRVFNMRTGEKLWETDLPAGGYATPATYEVNGKQYVVIACGGGKMGTPSGAAYVAFSL
ncbi:outer membrane protein assembly factor BamB family protein [Poritiphilus flavus]|uniref:PQQ-binding-like beta-propeller repeat protein n=1 Tax=Poritiphilus flavus TaxID=2697053 RepID=A0A6L9E827_9FLAO|nr:PQQ-binding-like beta-propeller repeat protein [Poritiphilus flavus]NAS10850.1 PQQ-binding-like beta-propeller repeat protein [Poritiphilus flavus]